MDALTQLVAAVAAVILWVLAQAAPLLTPETGTGALAAAAGLWVWGRRLQATRAVRSNVHGLALIWAVAIYTCKEWPTAKRVIRWATLTIGALVLAGWWMTADNRTRLAGVTVVLIPAAVGGFLEFGRWHGWEVAPSVASVRAAMFRDRAVALAADALERTVGPGSTISARRIDHDRLILDVQPPIGSDLGRLAEVAESGAVGNAVNRLARKHGVPDVQIAMASIAGDGPIQGHGVLVASQGGDPLAADPFPLPDVLDFEPEAPLLLGMGEVGDPETVAVDEEFTMLVGGQRGAGKSVFVQGLLCQLAMRPHTALVLCDPKRQEFRSWEGRATTLALGVKATGDAIRAVWEETVRRTDAATARKGVVSAVWPRIVLVVDELAMVDRSAPRGEKSAATLLRQTIAIGRSVNVSVVAATQRPSTDLIESSLRALFDVTVAFATRDHHMTETILGEARTPAHEIEIRGVGFARRQDRRHATRFRAWLVEDDQLARTAADTSPLRVDLGPTFPPVITHHITEDF